MFPEDPIALRDHVAALFEAAWTGTPKDASDLERLLCEQLCETPPWWLPSLVWALDFLKTRRTGARPTPEEFRVLDPLVMPAVLPWEDLYRQTYWPLTQDPDGYAAKFMRAFHSLVRLGLVSNPGDLNQIVLFLSPLLTDALAARRHFQPSKEFLDDLEKLTALRPPVGKDPKIDFIFARLMWAQRNWLKTLGTAG